MNKQRDECKTVQKVFDKDINRQKRIAHYQLLASAKLPLFQCGLKLFNKRK